MIRRQQTLRRRRRERNAIIPRPRVYRDRSNPLETMTDNELFKRYRFIDSPESLLYSLSSFSVGEAYNMGENPPNSSTHFPACPSSQKKNTLFSLLKFKKILKYLRMG
jgi:hypothetical protein